VNERNPDLLWQVTKFPAHGFAATVAGHWMGVPVLTRFAGDNFREYELASGAVERIKTYCLNNAFGRVAATAADATVVLGPYGRAEIERRGGGRLYEIPQPVNRERFEPAERSRAAIRDDLGLPTEERVLLSVGRVSRRKGMDDLVAAARDLAKQNADLTWCVIGDGPYRARVNSSPVVRAEGRVPHESISRYYQAADLVVHPSKIEGLPNVLLEAAACGTPTLARAVGDSAIVASSTYEDPDHLPSLVLESYVPVDLDTRFSPDRLRMAYERALVETARS
jgi:glycosyltransferase involved in cell wall biosynthesis